MTNRPRPVQAKIRAALHKARTTEPYPVWMTWEGVSNRIYGFYGRENGPRNARQVAERMYDVRTHRYTNGEHAGLQIDFNREEEWLFRQVVAAFPEADYPVDHPKYRPPHLSEILEAFRRGCHDDVVPVDLAKIATLINKTYKASLDPSEVAWWRVGIETRRREERRAVLGRIRTALGHVLAEQERRDIEARLVTVGPFRVDPLGSLDRCPCCKQTIREDSPLRQGLLAEVRAEAEVRVDPEPVQAPSPWFAPALSA